MRVHPLLLVIPFVAVGCIEYDVVTTDNTDVFTQAPAQAVDILLVVDNSGSMAPYQQKLGDSFDSFISYFVGANVDYHIAVTTTDSGYDPATHGAAGRIIGSVITPDTPDPQSAFAGIVNVGTSGAGYEMGLQGAFLALTDPLVHGTNADFLRDDASLSIIFVSDEEDASPQTDNDYINAFFAVKGQRARDVFNASALTVTDESVCTAQEAASSYPGSRYVDVATQTHGLTGNICADGVSFDNIVTDLSLNVSRLTDTFYLSDTPDPVTLQVSVNDVTIPCDDGSWSYDLVNDQGEDKPAVIFDRASLPETGSRIAIRYNHGDGDPTAFCPGGP